tara:strand:- start:317 stop:631 length:315 start_codon:yes stop_codon:yes gene_type:complete
MTWKNILKIDMKEARRLGNTYSPEDMDDARRADMDADMKALLPRMQDLVERIESTTDGLIRRNAMQMLSQLGGRLGMRRSPSREPRAFLTHVKAFIKANRRYLE